MTLYCVTCRDYKSLTTDEVNRQKTVTMVDSFRCPDCASVLFTLARALKREVTS